ncbi:MAG: phosphomethylpyrimidine synthase ThiC [Planctomycetota bacterium]
MKTELEYALSGVITSSVKKVAKEENIPAEELRNLVAQGKVVIVKGNGRKKSVAIGKGLRTKVNASIGTSSDIIDVDMEIEKAKVAEGAGADTLMELSTGGDLDFIRRQVLKTVSIPVGNVPLYQAAIESIREFGAVIKMTDEFLFENVKKQCKDGIGFMAIHCGVNLTTLERLRNQGYRYGGLVSRGGAFMTAWMVHNKRENPLFKNFDYLVSILKKYGTVLSLGNGMRAGAIRDSTDRAQVQELVVNAELAERARAQGVQVIVEGPGHIPIDEIETNVLLQKRLTNEAPFYMLGPIVTDVAAGYDHISSAVGASLSSAYGADFICYVTPAEHLALPFPDDVREGVITAKIAAHIGDMIKLQKRDDDLNAAMARRDLDWEKQFKYMLEPKKGQQIRKERYPEDEKTCTMCGEYCALRIVREFFTECEPCPVACE